MNRDNTKIWKGGLAGLLGANEGAGAGTGAGADAGAGPDGSAGKGKGTGKGTFMNNSAGASTRADAGRASVPELRATIARDAEPVAASAPPPKARTLVARYTIPSGAATGGAAPGTTTRILPIEQLIPDRAPAARQTVSAPLETEAQEVMAGIRAGRGRLIRRAVICALAVVVLALALTGSPESDASGQPTAGAPRPQAAAPSAQAPAVRAPSGAGDELGAVAVTRDRRQGAGSARPRTGLERAAVDALASGDHVTAIRLYEQLAGDHPDRTAFAHAARILKSRTARREP